MYAGTVTIPDPLLAWEIEDMPEGYTGYVRYDDMVHESPRDWITSATIINANDRLLNIDSDDEGLAEVRDRWHWLGTYGFSSRGQSYPPHYGEPTFTERTLFAKYDRERLVERYVAMFRPDIAVYVDRWDAGRENYGWGYVTREALAEAGYSEDGREHVSGTLQMRARAIFDQEVETYRMWAEGEVYGVTVIRDEDGEEASLWGIYDDYPYDYMQVEVVADLIAEMEV